MEKVKTNSGRVKKNSGRYPWWKLKKLVQVTFCFDLENVDLETIIGHLEPTIIKNFGEGYWWDNTYITVIGEEYATECIKSFMDDVYVEIKICIDSSELERGYVSIYISEASDNDHLTKSMHKLAAACKKALKTRKEYTDNIDIYQGKERATGKFKTTVKWSNGEVVTLRADKNTLPIYYIFAYAYCERKYGSNSAFKKYVDRHCVKMDKELIFEDDGLMTSMRIYQYGNGHPAIDLYSRVALLIAAKAYGGVETLKKVASNALH